MARTSPLHPPRHPDLPPPAPARAAGVHKWMLALTVLLAAAAAAFFSFDTESSYLYGIVIAFCIVAVGVPWLLWRIGARHPEAHPETADKDAAELAGHGDEGMADAVVPIAAVAFGLLALAVVLHFVARSLS